MPASEFELIERFFTRRGARREDVLAGVGDDGALVAAPAGGTLVFALDTLVEGAHFPSGFDARFVGHRALAVNLSDLAAMGAEPAWALLGVTLPSASAPSRAATAWPWWAATRPAVRSPSRSRSQASCRRARPSCARARAPATTCG